MLGLINLAAIDLLAFVDFLGNQLGLTFNGEVFFAGRLGTNTLIYDSLRERTFYQFLFGNGLALATLWSSSRQADRSFRHTMIGCDFITITALSAPCSSPLALPRFMHGLR